MKENPFDSESSLKRTQVEFRLQLSVIKHLRSAFPQVFFTAFPGRPGDAKDGYMKMMMGVKPGVADILLWYRLKPHGRPCSAGIELKAATGSWKSQQNLWASAFTAMGGKYAVCRSVREVHTRLCGWGLVPAHEAVVEPDIRSEQKKFADNFDFYAP